MTDPGRERAWKGPTAGHAIDSGNRFTDPVMSNNYNPPARNHGPMSLRSLGLALAAGVAAFLLVGVAVTELALAWIEFSLFVGLPAGLAAGAFVAAAVYLGLAEDAPARRRRVAVTAGGFGVGFLVVLVLIAVVVDLGVVSSLGVALFAGAVVAGAAWQVAGPEREQP